MERGRAGERREGREGEGEKEDRSKRGREFVRERGQKEEDMGGERWRWKRGR